jgi:hypothetical protein
VIDSHHCNTASPLSTKKSGGLHPLNGSTLGSVSALL